jgi:predicted regulator of Ras-like GTPase activity (Roadblock/LC7/MglB family)
MAAIAMLQDAADEDITELRKAVIVSQNELLRDDTIDEDELAQRVSAIMHAYSGAANAALAEAEAIGTSMQTLSANAIACGKAVTA